MGWAAAAIAAVIILGVQMAPRGQWVDVPVHSTLETIGALAAILMAIFLLYGETDVPTWNRSSVALGLLGMGVLDAFHATSASGHAFVFLRVGASLAGGIGYALAWVPVRAHDRAVTRWAGLAVAGLCVCLGVFALGWPDMLPRMLVTPDPESYRADTFAGNALLLNGFSRILYGIGAVKILHALLRSGKVDDGLFGFLGVLLVVSAITMPLAPVWGTAWWQWHFIRLAAYLAVLAYLVWAYARMSESLARYRDHLQELVAGRTTELISERESLERRVRERTEELADLNEEMQAEMEERRQAQELIRVRLRLMEFAAGHSLEELLVATLDEVGALTGSPIGFYHFVDPDQKTLTLQAWSTRTEKEYCTAKGKGDHYAIDAAGVWVECVHQRRPVIHNDYASLPDKKGLPEGHAPLIRELVVPIFRGDRIVAILGVGNKPVEYAQPDVDVVAYLADVAWDIADRKRAEEVIQRQAAIIESSDDAILSKSLDGTIVSWNRGAEAMYGYAAAEIVGQSVFRIVPGEKRDELREILARIAREEKVDHLETMRLKKDGTRIDVAITVSPVRDSDGKIIGASVIARDITTRIKAQHRLEESEDRFHRMAENIQDGLIMLEGGRLVFFNRRACDIFGYSQKEMLEQTLWSLLAPEETESMREMVAEETGAGEYQREVEMWVRRHDGSRRFIQARFSSLQMEDSRKNQYIVLTDITERKQREDELQYLSFHDPLTGLYNRAFFEETVDRLERSRQFPLSVIMVDVDGLKRVNDGEGHAAGDELLRRAALALSAVFRGDDIIARIGGDEFVVLLPATDAPMLAIILARVRASVTGHAPLGLSLGAATVDEPGGGSITRALRTADSRLYEEKARKGAARSDAHEDR